MKPKQLALLPKGKTEHGGSVRAGKRKIARPLDSKKPMHLVFRSTKARGEWSFLHRRNKGQVHLLMQETAERFGIKVFRFENVGNHLHLIVKGRTRRDLRKFLRVFPQRVMFLVTGACKGNPQGRFFDAIAYSRVVQWGREFKILKTYLWKNAMEVLGFPLESLSDWRGIYHPIRV